MKFSDYLTEHKIQSVGLWLEESQAFACVLLHCLHAKVRVLLPPNLLEENRQWIVENADIFICDENLATFGILQKIDEIQPLVSPENLTEIWLKTSGSSGEAKIIRKTAAQMWREATALSKTLPLEKGEDVRLLGSVSTQHLYGLTFRIFLPLAMGWQLGNEALQYPEYLIAETRHHKAVWISSPALLMNLNLDNPELANLPLAGIVSSGGALPETVASQLRQTLSCPIIEIYGSTETGVIASRIQAGLWQPIPQNRLGLNDDGALWVESPWINGREQTADSVNLSPNGFELLGRIDRIVKLGDKRIALAKIEHDLLKHNWVTDCYIGLHPEHQRPVAWVALSEDALKCERKSVIAELKHHLSTTQERFALPRYWRFCEKLPRNSQSKISRGDFETICRQIQSISR